MSDGFPWSQSKHKNAPKPYFPLDDFFKHARRNLKEIKHTQESLQEAHTKFSGMMDIWQYHCDFALDALKTLDKSLQEFRHLVKRYEMDFPTAICHYWYKLMIEIDHIDGESHTLKMLLIPSHISQQSFPKYILKRREEIYLGIDALIQNSNHFCQKIDHLLNVAQFLSRQGDTPCDLESEIEFDASNQEFTCCPISSRSSRAPSSIVPEEEFATVHCGLFVVFPAATHQLAQLDNSLP